MKTKIIILLVLAGMVGFYIFAHYVIFPNIPYTITSFVFPMSPDGLMDIICLI